MSRNTAPDGIAGHAGGRRPGTAGIAGADTTPRDRACSAQPDTETERHAQPLEERAECDAQIESGRHRTLLHPRRSRPDLSVLPSKESHHQRISGKYPGGDFSGGGACYGPNPHHLENGASPAAPPPRAGTDAGRRSGELDFIFLLGMVVASLRLPIRKGLTMAAKPAVKSSKQSARTLKERRAEKRAKALESTQFLRKRKS